jgi:hypothetical protein
LRNFLSSWAKLPLTQRSCLCVAHAVWVWVWVLPPTAHDRLAGPRPPGCWSLLLHSGPCSSGSASWLLCSL